MPERRLKVDLHTHILPEHLPDLTERYGTPGFIQLDHHAPGCARMILDGALFREIQDNCWDPQRRLEDAAPLFQRALEIYQKALGRDHYQVASVLGNLALVQTERRKYPEAERLYVRAMPW